MLEATLADLRKSSSFFKTKEVVHIVNGRKKQEVGYFVPISLKNKFTLFLEEVERDEKIKLLKKVALASEQQPINDGAVNDEIR